MGRNTTGGNKQKRGKNSTHESKKRPLTYADNKETLYGLVISPLGDCGFLVHCNDNIERIGYIRGSMYKSCFIQSGDMTLVSLREFEQVKLGRKERCDVILKYHAEEVTQLVKRGLYYKDSVRPFLTKLEKGKSTKFDHLSDTNSSRNYDMDDDIITVVTDAPPPPVKKAKASAKNEKDDAEEEEDDSEFLLAKEDLNDFYGSQDEEDNGGKKEKKVAVVGGGQEEKGESGESSEDGGGFGGGDGDDGDGGSEDNDEKFDCFGNSATASASAF